MGKKGQISIEYLTLTAMLLLVVVLMFVFSVTTLNENTRFNSAYLAVRELVNAADKVSTQNGSSIVIEVELPSGVSSFETFGNEVKIEMDSYLSIAYIFDSGKTSITPTSLSTDEGTHFIQVESTDENVTFTEI